MASSPQSGADRPGAADSASFPDLPYRRERLYLILALALLAGISLYLIEVQREQTWRRAEDGVLNLAVALQSSSSGTLERSLSSLRGAGAALARSAAPSGDETRTALQDAIRFDPLSAFLGIEGDDGSITLVDRSGAAATAEVAQAVAAQLPVARGAEPVLHSLIRLPHDAEAYLPLSLALSGSRGRAAFALVAAHSLTAGTEGLRLVPDGWVGWLVPDGTRLLFYSPSRGEMQINGPQVPADVMRLNRGSSGYFAARGPVDGLQYIVGYSRSVTLPMLVGVTVPSSALYGEWALKALGPALVLLAGVIAVLIFWSRLHATLRREQFYHRQRGHMLGELQELAGRLLRSQDEERRRIGLELHDSTVQLLAVLEFNLDRLAASDRQAGRQTPELFQECIELVHRCSVELRTTSYLLHPPLLDELGLLSALRWMADGLRQRSDIRVELQLPHTMARLPREVELPLFRVAQEALSNVHRHSRSPTVVIRLRTLGESVTLEVEDAGRGILDDLSTGATSVMPSSGVGLASMRVRMRQLGGTLRIETSEHGTCIRAELPLLPRSPPAQIAAPPPGETSLPEQRPAARA